MTPMIPLSLARRSCVGGTNAPAASIPLSGAATWSPSDGLRIHDALDVAAAYVVATTGARILVTGAGLPGLTCAAEAALLERARAAL